MAKAIDGLNSAANWGKLTAERLDKCFGAYMDKYPDGGQLDTFATTPEDLEKYFLGPMIMWARGWTRRQYDDYRKQTRRRWRRTMGSG